MDATLRSRWLRRGIYAAVIAAIVVGLYAIAGFAVVPRLLRSELTSFVSTHYHRRLTLDNVRFNPFTLTLDTGTVSLPDADAAPMLSVRALHVELQFASLWRRGASFGRIVLDHPFARVVVRKDGSVNIGDLAKPFAHAPERKPATKPMRLFVDQLAIVRGRVTFTDDSRSTPFRVRLDPVDFTLSRFRSVGTAPNRYALDFATALGARFHAGGRLTLDPLASSGTFTLAGLRAATLRAYLGKAVNFDVPSGVVALNGGYALTPAGGSARTAGAAATPATGAGSSSAPADIKVDLQRLTVTRLDVRPPGAQTNLVEVGLVDVRGAHVDLARRALSVDSVALRGGSIQASIDADGTLNLSRLMADAAPAKAGATSAGSSSSAAGGAAISGAATGGTASASGTGWSIAAPDISVSDFKIAAEDRAVTPPAALTLDHVALHVQGFRSPSDAPLALSANASIGPTGQLAARGTYDLRSGAASVRVALTQFDLTPLQPFLAARSALKLSSGWLTTTLDIRRTAAGVLSVTGNSEVTKLRTVDDLLGRDFVKWSRLTVEGMSYRSQPASLAIRSIVAVAPYVRVTVTPQRKLSLFELFTAAHQTAAGRSDVLAARTTAAGLKTTAQGTKPVRGSGGPGATQTAAAAQSGAPAVSSMTISVDRVRILNASAHYTDLWIVPHFFLAIQQLSGDVTGLSSNPRSRATVSLEGKVDQFAPIGISGTINLLAATRYSDMRMNFRGVQLTTATPYSARFAGYKIDKGTMSANITYHLENGELSADPHFIIDQLELGEKVASPDAIHLPLKLAVALLKDRHGVIDIDLPISGSMSDPKFRLGPLIWKAVVNLLAKAATAPFALLGRLVGGGEQLKYIDFDPGSAALDASAQSRLATLAKALEDRPNLKLDVPSAYAPTLDRPALARQTLDQQLVALIQKEPAARRRATAGSLRAAGSRGRVASSEPAGGAESANPTGTGPLPSSGVGTASVPLDGGGSGSGSGSEDGAALPPELSDPAARLRLLVADYRSQLGAKTALPPAALAALKSKGRKQEAAPLAPAIAELESALLAHIQVPDHELERLGRRRARAIEEALLQGTKIDPARLFVLNTGTTKADGARVRLALGLE